MPDLVTAKNRDPFVYPNDADLGFYDIAYDYCREPKPRQDNDRQGWELHDTADNDEPLDWMGVKLTALAMAKGIHVKYQHQITEGRAAAWSEFRGLLANCWPSELRHRWSDDFTVRWTFQDRRTGDVTSSQESQWTPQRYIVESHDSLPKHALSGALRNADQAVDPHQLAYRQSEAKHDLAELMTAHMTRAVITSGSNLSNAKIEVAEHDFMATDVSKGHWLRGLVTNGTDDWGHPLIDDLTLYLLDTRTDTPRGIHEELMSESIVDAIDNTRKLQAVIRLLRQPHMMPLFTEFEFTPLPVTNKQ